IQIRSCVANIWLVERADRASGLTEYPCIVPEQREIDREADKAWRRQETEGLAVDDQEHERERQKTHNHGDVPGPTTARQECEADYGDDDGAEYTLPAWSTEHLLREHEEDHGPQEDHGLMREIHLHNFPKLPRVDKDEFAIDAIQSE